MAVSAISGNNIVEGRANELDQGPSGSLDISGEVAAHGGKPSIVKEAA